MPTSYNENLQDLIESARPFLREDVESIDKNLPNLLSIIRSAGASEFFHRLGTFSDHLFHVYRILKLWKAPDPICLFGLLHSVYSNSYHDMAIFDPLTDHETVRNLVGTVAKELIHLFCIVPRQTLIHNDLMHHYTDSERRDHLQASGCYLNAGKDESWRKKLREVAPSTGIQVNHIRTGEPMVIPRRVLAVFLLMSIVDYADQYYGYQDEMHGNTNGRLEFSENNFDVLWPGNGKPGLWMNMTSIMAAIYTLLVRDEEILKQKQQSNCHENGFEELELVIPPVFDRCTKILDPSDQIIARDLYWEAVYDQKSREKGEELLVKSIDMNPLVGEPHVLLSQFYMSRGRFEEAEQEAEKGLRLLLEWGCTWDKRVSWEGWVAWSRVLLSKATDVLLGLILQWGSLVWALLSRCRLYSSICDKIIIIKPE
ncbi:uncharacterized protein LOC143590285 [Bidens hawaiensis]|uniref:uncharacterized protein LOC143590285 n=1 Tax=Bidens hawaiensis TaxID=980011 RepID=UPI00404AB417